MSNIILISSIFIGLIYILFLLIRKTNSKKLLLNIVIIIILILLINLIKGLFINKEFKNNINIENTKETSTTTKVKTSTNEIATTSSTTTNTTSKKTTTKVNPTTTKEVTTKSDNTPSTYNGISSKGYKIEYKDGAYYVDGYLIVNKSYPLTSDWVPTNTYKKITPSMDGFCRECIDNEAYNAWLTMKSDAAAVGYNMWIQSGYRGYYYQRDLYNGYVSRKGQAAADKSSARAGHSEHQSGLAFDICSDGYGCISSSFNNTPPANWLSENCYLYGYILRYPENKTDETGYMHESWHFRYVGKELAKNLYNDGNWITMESYFGIDSKYSN